MPSLFCLSCGRALTDADSIRRGVGPVCAMKGHVLSVGDVDADAMDHLDIPLSSGFVFGLTPDGKVATNIPWLVTYHSPTGFAWGYGGSGPADMALNIIEAVLRHRGYKGPKITLTTGDRLFAASERHHQEFKRQFLVGLPPEGGLIPYETVEKWLIEAMDGYARKQGYFGWNR
jgi:hypothetical protein